MNRSFLLFALILLFAESLGAHFKIVKVPKGPKKAVEKHGSGKSSDAGSPRILFDTNSLQALLNFKQGLTSTSTVAPTLTGSLTGTLTATGTGGNLPTYPTNTATNLPTNTSPTNTGGVTGTATGTATGTGTITGTGGTGTGGTGTGGTGTGGTGTGGAAGAGRRGYRRRRPIRRYRPLWRRNIRPMLGLERSNDVKPTKTSASKNKRQSVK